MQQKQVSWESEPIAGVLSGPVGPNTKCAIFNLQQIAVVILMAWWI